MGLMGHLVCYFGANVQCFFFSSVDELLWLPSHDIRGVVPKFSDLEVIALSLTAETMSIDSENYLFMQLAPYKSSFPNMISRRQFNDRRKFTGNLCETIRKRIADNVDGGEDYFCIDSKPIEVCRTARGKRCQMGKKDYLKAPSFGWYDGVVPFVVGCGQEG